MLKKVISIILISFTFAGIIFFSNLTTQIFRSPYDFVMNYPSFLIYLNEINPSYLLFVTIIIFLLYMIFADVLKLNKIIKLCGTLIFIGYYLICIFGRNYIALNQDYNSIIEFDFLIFIVISWLITFILLMFLEILKIGPIKYLRIPMYILHTIPFIIFTMFFFIESPH